MILNTGFVNEEDLIIFLAGTPFFEKSRVNRLRFETM